MLNSKIQNSNPFFYNNSNKKRNVIFFKGLPTKGIVELSQDYFTKNPPPKGVLNIGLVGSAMDGIKPHSDYDFFSICKKINAKNLLYYQAFIAHINSKTHKWADMITGEISNNATAGFNKFTLDYVLDNHVEMYGKNAKKNLKQMINNNTDNEPVEEFLLRKIWSAGNKILRSIVELNEHQLSIENTCFEPSAIKVLNPEEVKANYIAKQILSSCSFANTLHGHIHSIPRYSEYVLKKRAPEIFQEIYNFNTPIPNLCREIYYGDKKIDYKKFNDLTATKWIKVQDKLQIQLQKEVDALNLRSR